MNEAFVLELLPARGLDQSMLLPVLVGLLVVLLCTETLGWVFAGAVVPGYLSSVLVIQPVTGAIVVFESLVTLAISAALAKVLSKTDAWTRFFGRERFFLILVVSLVVRMHDHAWFAPWAIGWLDLRMNTTLETQQEFYSVGLVLVPLTANMLWKPAIHRGLMQLAVQVGLTFVIVKFLLLPYTNLSLSSVELTYENAAINFVGHAKAHIILLTTAAVAAQFNLTYGWDFNGILVPALLGLLWLTPLKLVASLFEAVVVFYLTKGFLRLPVIRHMDFEGPRKIVLVFCLAFLWKVVIGFSLGPALPTVKVSDLYGFGYLLSSLLAVKMIGKKSVRGVLLPSLFASAGGFVLGSAIGFMLELIAPQRPAVPLVTEPESTRLATTPLGVMTLARMDYQARPQEPLAPEQYEIGALEAFWDLAAEVQRAGYLSRFNAFGSSGQVSQVDELRQAGAGLGLQVVELGSVLVGVEDGETPLLRRQWLGIVARGSGPRQGFPTGLLVPEAKGPVLVVPMPASEAPVAEAAAVACRRVDCRAVLVGGVEQRVESATSNQRPLEMAMAAFAGAPTVVMRGDIVSNFSVAMAASAKLEGSDKELATAKIHQLRGYFDLVELWPNYELDWEPRVTVVEPPPGDGDFVLLRTTRDELQNFVDEHAESFYPPELRELRTERIDAPLDENQLIRVLTDIQEFREPPGTEGAGYKAPSASELLTLEQLIVAPLMHWADTSAPGQPLPPQVRVYADELDYELLELGSCRSGIGDCLVVMHERTRKTTAGWGTLVVRRPRGRSEHLVEVPRPNKEIHTWRVGAELWQVMGARALLIAGADGLPYDPRAANQDPLQDDAKAIGPAPPNPDPVRAGNLETPFHAFHQAIDRSAPRTFEFVQVRGIASYRPVTRDVIIGVGLPERSDRVEEDCWGVLQSPLQDMVAGWNSCQLADGSEDLYLLSGAGTPQIEYSRELGNGVGRIMWLSAGLRERFSAPRSVIISRVSVIKGLEQAGFNVAERAEESPDGEASVVIKGEVVVLNAPMLARNEGRGPDGRRRVAAGLQGFERALGYAVAYAETGNLHALRALRELVDRSYDLRVEAAVGRDSAQPFLLVDYVGEALGRRALVLLDYRLSGVREVSYAVLGFDAVLQLRKELLARPQVLLITDIEVIQPEALVPAPVPQPESGAQAQPESEASEQAGAAQ